MKVLHIVENLHRGAVENWLIRMLKYAADQGIQLNWTFYCQLQEAGSLECEARKLGADVICSPYPIRKTTKFVKALRSELVRGRYDVMHCHHDIISGLYLAAAVGLPIRSRLVHIHNPDEAVLTPSKLKQALVRPLLRHCCLFFGDRIVGISEHTLDTFLKGRRRRKGVDLIHYYGIESQPFKEAAIDRDGFRADLRLPLDSKIVLFASRIVEEKNPLFAVDVFGHMNRIDPKVVCVFVGAGALEEDVKARIKKAGLDDSFRSLGWRRNIPEIMCSCDWFILPRPEFPQEGLGIAVIEAQLAGLDLVLSLGIPDDALLPGASALRLPLDLGAYEWATRALQMVIVEGGKRERAIKELSESPFAMKTSLGDLLSIHGKVYERSN